MANTYLTRTAGTPTNAKKFTISFWSKRTKLSADQQILGFETDSNNKLFCWFNGSDQFDFINKSSNSTTMRLKTTRVFRDPSAWYHIVLAVDTTDSTSTDRLKLYVNGSRQLSANNGYASETYPSADATASVGGTHIIGADHNGGSQQYFYDGILTHVHYTDGYVYTPSTFGETDSTSGIWKPKTSPSVTYGTNGYFLKFENSGAMGTDSSGNTNTFTPAGTLTQNVDTPSNNFATLNPFYYETNLSTLSSGNLKASSSGAAWKNIYSNMAVGSGKWYCEIKIDSWNGSNTLVTGVISVDSDRLSKTASGDFFASATTAIAYNAANGNKVVENTETSYGNSYTSGDILGIAMDLDNNKLYFSKNGTFQNSGVPTSGSTGTGAISMTANTDYVVAIAHYNTQVASFNFGQGFFGTTAVASANADGNGFGAFEYAVPTGYYSLCTKNIKEFG